MPVTSLLIMDYPYSLLALLYVLTTILGFVQIKPTLTTLPLRPKLYNPSTVLSPKDTFESAKMQLDITVVVENC